MHLEVKDLTDLVKLSPSNKEARDKLAAVKKKRKEENDQSKEVFGGILGGKDAKDAARAEAKEVPHASTKGEPRASEACGEIHSSHGLSQRPLLSMNC